MINLEKIKKFISDRDSFAEVKDVIAGNEYVTYKKMEIDEKQQAAIVDGVRFGAGKSTLAEHKIALLPHFPCRRAASQLCVREKVYVQRRIRTSRRPL